VPHGIEVLTAADYFTLSSRSQVTSSRSQAAPGVLSVSLTNSAAAWPCSHPGAESAALLRQPCAQMQRCSTRTCSQHGGEAPSARCMLAEMHAYQAQVGLKLRDATHFQAFTVVAPCLAAFPEYRSALRDALLERKLRHWDRELRALAATALGALVPTDPVWAAQTALPALRGLCLSPVLEVRMWPAMCAGVHCMAFDATGDDGMCGSENGALSSVATRQGEHSMPAKGSAACQGLILLLRSKAACVTASATTI